MRIFIILSSLLTITACAPMIESSTPRFVMLSNVSGFNSTKAFKIAESECNKHKRHAVHIPDNQRDGVSSYECKD